MKDTKPKSLSAAIRLSIGCVSVHGSGTSWVIIGPYNVSDQYGPRAEATATSYRLAVKKATEWRSCIVLSLMGQYTDDAMYAVENALTDPYADHTIRGFISAALRANAQH